MTPTERAREFLADYACVNEYCDAVVRDLLDENEKYRAALEEIARTGGYTDMQDIAREALT